MPLMLLDYGNPKPFGKIVGRERHLAWPVNAYRVTLPMSSEDAENLNPFERVILKLIDAGGSTEADQLAVETCIPSDLVQCVLLRLRDKAYIDEYNRIIIEKRNEWMLDQDSRKSIVTAVLFRELSSGRILPFLHLLNSSNPLRQKEDTRQFQMIRSDDTHARKHPEASDVISALRGMLKRSKAFGKSTLLPSVRQITVVAQSEPYLLDCPIAILMSDGDFRIADPFGNGFSLILESAYNKILERDEACGKWMSDWRKSLSNPAQERLIAAKKEPYDNEANRARYPKLISVLNAHISHRQNRSIEQLHNILEWALFYSCVERPYSPAIQKLRLTSQPEHPALLKSAAERLSLTLPPEGLFAVLEGKLNDFLEGKAELGTVLSLSLLMAAVDPYHPIHRIASTYRDFVKRLFSIKKNRDESAHGVSGVRRMDVELSDEAFTRDVVTNLLSNVTFDGSTAGESNTEHATGLLLDARTSIQGEFGYKLFNQMGINLQERLINAEQFWLRCRDGDNALPFVCDLSAALQIAFRRTLYGAMPPDIAESDYLATAGKIAVEHGLGDLPECLLTSKRSSIRETLLGSDQTLQSCLVAFLLVSAPETLSAVAQAHPSFITDLAQLIDRRGHGNEPTPLPRDAVRGLRRAVYTIISTLQES
jgi:hypothetical protein